MLRLIALLALLPDLASACPPPPPPAFEPLLADGATLIGTGGVLFREGFAHDEDAAGSPALRDAATDAVVAADWKPLAPGLMLLQPKTEADRELAVVSASGRVLRTIHQLRAQAVLATPVIARARATGAKANPRHASPMMILPSVLTLELRTPLPSNAVALVVTDPASAWGRMWFAPTKGQTTFTMNAGGGKSCGGGMGPVYIGEKITVLWVDAHGRISPPSKPIRVGRT